jgi:hypothetical protein
MLGGTVMHLMTKFEYAREVMRAAEVENTRLDDSQDWISAHCRLMINDQ